MLSPFRTIGTIAPPIGKGPAMTAKCWAKVVQHDGFDVVDLNFLSPSDLHAKALPVGPAFGQLPGNKRTVEEARYGFVVSVRGTVPYDSLEQSRTRTGHRRVYGYFLQHGKWHVDGYGHCRGGALGWGRGVFFEDIAGCPE